MLIIYPAIFHREDDTYWVEFPDLQGCHTYGDTLPDAFENAKEALEGYCLTLLENDKPLNHSSSISDIHPDDEDAFVTLIDCELKNTSKRAVKKTLTIPYWLNELAIKENVNFSTVLQNALIEHLNIRQ